MTDIDLSGDGGVVKRVLRHAKPEAPSPSDATPIADVHYEGSLEESGEVFDSSREDDAVFTFEVGKGKVIRAWEMGVKSMKVGELARLTCTADYAYGAAGSPPDIPPGATLVFELELMAVKAPKGSSSEGSANEKLRLEEIRKEREIAAAIKEEEKKKREDAKAAAAANMKEKLEGKKGGGKSGGKRKK